jgi:hypothetical protein
LVFVHHANYKLGWTAFQKELQLYCKEQVKFTANNELPDSLTNRDMPDAVDDDTSEPSKEEQERRAVRLG